MWFCNKHSVQTKFLFIQTNALVFDILFDSDKKF